MKLISIIVAAALLPAAALAGPSATNAQSASPQQSVEVEAFEWSTGQGRLGLMLMGLTPQLRAYFGAPNDSGLLVAQVAPNSPASRAGIKVGDVITKVDNQNVESADDIASATQQQNTGAQANAVKIHLVRDHKAMNLQASLK
jgi:S1-C subfamily serine protease